MNIDSYRNEHKAILREAGNLGRLLSNTVENSSKIVKLLFKIDQILEVHFAKEDGILYPAFIDSANPNNSKVGEMFLSEMGGVEEAWSFFLSRWNVAAKIEEDEERFKVEVDAVFQEIKGRIEAEDSILFPLCSKI